ncbi:hypothetical protein [Psychrobacter urativorans]|uniref:Uncharacterized protein n=1 Tax=Psychrobacter urativorans TaxID=45610 RepID=A0A0M4T2W2_9GAMM|nr:hypothetical protein [Psychrobacter urativorans]ALF60015.1 hypothetical protein AOC03_08140 [Psychrobacter urativorans]
MINKKIDWAVICTALWIIFWVSFFMKGFDSNEGFGGLGAFLSGIFAPLALFWFYKSYRVQTNELGLQRQELELQREELTLQRKALEQSVMAQKGSEAALKAQLAITEQQFSAYLKEYEGRKPFFILLDDGYNKLKIEKPIGNGNTLDITTVSQINTSEWSNISAKCYLTIKNIGGVFELIDIEVTVTPTTINKKIKAHWTLNRNIKQGFIAYSIVLTLRNNFQTLSPKDFITFSENTFSDIILNFQYQYADTSSSDLYQLKVDNEVFALEKLM